MRKKMLKVTFVIVAACITVTSCAILPPEWSMTNEQRLLIRQINIRSEFLKDARQVAIGLNDNGQISNQHLHDLLNGMRTLESTLEETKQGCYKNEIGLEDFNTYITAVDKAIGRMADIAFLERVLALQEKRQREEALKNSSRPIVLPSPTNRLNSCTVGCNVITNGVCQSYALICP